MRLFVAMAPAAPATEEDASLLPSPPRLLPLEPFPVAVIGLGLIGSAASRHLSLTLGSSLLAIGPPEPISWRDHSGPFSSHYDQGRLTRIGDPDSIWASLAARSMARYASLQQESGIVFHHPVGCLRVSPLLDEPGDSLLQSFEAGKKCGANQEMIQCQETLRKKFPYFEFQSGDTAIMECGGAGFINPRSLVSAQLAVAEKNGACIVRETVAELLPTGEVVRMVTDKGKTLLARKVLVCAGSYSSFLIPNRKLDLRTEARTVLLAEVGEEEESKLAGMPTFIWRLKGNKRLKWVYGCPPVRYPDGKLAVKIGGTQWEATKLGRSQAEVAEWFKGGGDPAEQRALEGALLAELMPRLKVQALSTKPCMVSNTAHHRPYIDAADGVRPPLTARVFVAAGGCGAAAKSSDEIGRLAAHLASTGKWASEDLDPALFRAVFR